jgi:hypothetical protein
MWCALGHCYESEGLHMPGLAVRCYRRAVAHGDREGIGLAKLVSGDSCDTIQGVDGYLIKVVRTAVRRYTRAVAHGDREGIRLAKLVSSHRRFWLAFVGACQELFSAQRVVRFRDKDGSGLAKLARGAGCDACNIL